MARQPLIDLVIIGVPLAGKSTAMRLLSETTGSPLFATTTPIPEGHWKGGEEGRLDLIFARQGRTFRLSTLPGGAAYEAMYPMLESASSSIFFFDGARERLDHQVEFWRKLSARWPAAPSACIINRRPASDEIATAELLRAVGADSLPVLEISAIEPADGARLRDFIVKIADQVP